MNTEVAFKRLISDINSWPQEVLVKIHSDDNTFCIMHTEVIKYLVQIHNYTFEKLDKYVKESIDKKVQIILDHDPNVNEEERIKYLHHYFEDWYKETHHELPESKEYITKNVELLVETDLSQGYRYFYSFIKKALILGDEMDTARIFDVFYEQQLFQALTDVRGDMDHDNKYLIIMKDGHIVDFYARRYLYQDICDAANAEDFGHYLFMSIAYFYRLHKYLKLFHGDIKPRNIFVTGYDSTVLTDSGSLLPLYATDEEVENYIVKLYTPGYASLEHVKSIQAQKRFNRRQLMREDMYQFR